MFFYVRCINEVFEVVKSYKLKPLLRKMVDDIANRIAQPLCINDEIGNSVYNRKELITIYNDECKKGVHSWLNEN